MLQVCRTDNKGNRDSVFNTVYEGEELSYLVSDLEPNVSYTFRVCSRFGKDGRWSSWSIPRNGISSLDPHGKKKIVTFSVTITFEMIIFAKFWASETTPL